MINIVDTCPLELLYQSSEENENIIVLEDMFVLL